MGEQHFGGGQIAAQHCGVQGRMTWRAAVHVGAGREQQFEHGGIAAVDRHDQRRRAESIAFVDFGPGRDEQLRRTQVAGAGGEYQGRVAAFLDPVHIGGIAVLFLFRLDELFAHERAGMDIGAIFDQGGHDLGMTAIRSPHQRRLFAGDGDVGVGAGREQRAHQGAIAALGGSHDGGFTRQ